MNYAPHSPILPQAAAQPLGGQHEPSPLDWVPQLLGFLRRRWWIIALSAAFFTGLAIAYAISARPSFTATATVLIDTRKLHPFRQQTLVGEPGSEASFIESQVAILTSEEVTRAVVRRLNLLEDQVFTGEALPPLKGLAGMLAKARQLPRQIRAALFPSAPTEEAVPPDAEQAEILAASQLTGMMRVRRVAATSLVTVQVDAPEPELAARLANAVLDAYVDTQFEAIAGTTRRASAWLEERMRSLREAALAAGHEVQDFRVRRNIIGTDRGLINEQQMQELATQLTQARTRVAEAEARLSRIQGAASAELPDAAVAEMLQSQLIMQLRSQLLELTRREADFSQRFGPNHGSVHQIRNEITELRRSIASELRRILEAARADLAGARENEAQAMRQMEELIQQWASTNNDRITLRSLEGVATSYQQLFENFLVRYTQVVQDESYPVSEARVVSSASPPLHRSQPRTTLLAAGGAMLGIGFGFALAFLLEAADRRLRTPMQARAAIGGECVGIIPHLRRGLLGTDTAALMREVLERPNSRFSEAVHGLQTRVAQHCLRLRDARVIACVGAASGAGTSTVAAALALCLAQSGRRTVLLDWDLREGTTSDALAPEARAGFWDVFEGRVSTMDALLRDPQTGLRLMARGQATMPRHPAGVLGSEKARTILGQLRAEHDFVVVDLPALGQLADAHAAAAAVDGFLFVLEWGGPGPQVIAEVLSRFDAGSAVSFGAVLNKVDIAKALRYVSLGEAAYIRAV